MFIEENFDRFVAVKAGEFFSKSRRRVSPRSLWLHAALYAGMQNGIFAEHTDRASKPLKDHLKVRR